MSDKRRYLRLSGVFLVALALLLGLYTLIAYLGWQSGETMRAERIEEDRAAALETQVARAAGEIETGSYRLALRRLEWVLEKEPAYEPALTLRAEAQQAQAGDSAPTPLPSPTGAAATATAPATLPAEGTPSGDVPARALQALQLLVEEEAWAEAIPALVEFQNQFPAYERRESDRLLYEAYIGRGVDLLYGDRVELGLYYLTQAQKLGDLPQEVRDQRQWAELYLRGMAYYGVGWGVAISNFRDLCLVAPFYQNSCGRLRVALTAHADQYVAAQDWCPAVTLYEEAYRLEQGEELAGKLEQARAGCQNATPPATEPLTGTLRFPDR